MREGKRFAPWRHLPVGTQVTSLTYKKGSHGAIHERLENRVDGLCRYGVRLENDPNNIADFCRYELKTR